MRSRRTRRDQDYRGERDAPDFSRLVYQARRKSPGALEVLQDAIWTYFPKQLEAAVAKAQKTVTPPALVIFDSAIARRRFMHPSRRSRPTSKKGPLQLESPFIVLPNYYGETVRVIRPTEIVIWSTQGGMGPAHPRIRSTARLREERRTTQRYADLALVRGVAEEIDEAIKVTLDGDEIVLRAHGVTERYDTPEAAIGALRASWSPEA